MEAAQPLRGSSEDRQWQVASSQSASRADVPVLCVSACCSAAARSAAANAGLVWKLGYAAIGVRLQTGRRGLCHTNFRCPGLRHELLCEANL
jgi:hypothetical protein